MSLNITNLLLSKIQDLAEKQEIDPKSLVGKTLIRGNSKYHVMKYDSKKAEFTLSDTKTEVENTIKMSLKEFKRKRIEIIIDK